MAAGRADWEHSVDVNCQTSVPGHRAADGHPALALLVILGLLAAVATRPPLRRGVRHPRYHGRCDGHPEGRSLQRLPWPRRRSRADITWLIDGVVGSPVVPTSRMYLSLTYRA